MLTADDVLLSGNCLVAENGAIVVKFCSLLCVMLAVAQSYLLKLVGKEGVDQSRIQSALVIPIELLQAIPRR